MFRVSKRKDSWTVDHDNKPDENSPKHRGYSNKVAIQSDENLSDYSADVTDR